MADVSFQVPQKDHVNVCDGNVTGSGLGSRDSHARLVLADAVIDFTESTTDPGDPNVDNVQGSSVNVTPSVIIAPTEIMNDIGNDIEVNSSNIQVEPMGPNALSEAVFQVMRTIGEGELQACHVVSAGRVGVRTEVVASHAENGLLGDDLAICFLQQGYQLCIVIRYSELLAGRFGL